MEKGFSTEAVDRTARIRDFVRQHSVANMPDAQVQLANLDDAIKAFVNASNILEEQLTETERVLRRSFTDWDSYQMFRDGLENLADDIEMSCKR